MQLKGSTVWPFLSAVQRYLNEKLHVLSLDFDLARLYGVTTRRLNEQVRRNLKRFPKHFMFQTTQEEWEDLMSHFATSRREPGLDKESWGGRRKFPLAFTERGVLMVSNILKSDRAIEVSLEIIEAFVRLRQMILGYADLAQKIKEIESKLATHDDQFQIFQELLLPLLDVNVSSKRKIGFDPDRE